MLSSDCRPYGRRGVLFLDVLIGTAVFAVIVSGVIYAMLFSQQGMLKGGNRIRAVLLNQKAVAAMRSIRDEAFDQLTEGAHGIALSDGLWVLSGTGSTTADGYTTSVTITPVDTENIDIAVETSWYSPAGIRESVALHTSLTDWHRTLTIGDWSSVSLGGAYVDDGTPLFNDAAIGETYAFVTSETSDGGVGLYVFDISTLSSPVRVAESFTLGAPGYQVLLIDSMLYVVTGDGSSEVRVYDVSTPAALSAADLVATIDVPGTANVRAMQYAGGILYLAAQEDSGEGELFTYDVSNLSAITAFDALDDPGASYSDIGLSNGYAYLASSMDTMELRIVDVFDPADLVVAPGGGYNVTDTPDGTSLVIAGDYLILGRNQGDVTEELHLFDISDTPVPDTAPQNAETGEDVNALDADPTGTYAFAATNHDSQELIVLDIDTFASGGNPITAVYNTATGFGRGVRYSITHDRLFLMTNTAFIILKPA